MIRPVQFVSIGTAQLGAPEDLISAWSVIDPVTRKEIGVVASSVQPFVSPSGKTYTPVKWGFAVSRDEFRSGIQFSYSTRQQAVTQVLPL